MGTEEVKASSFERLAAVNVNAHIEKKNGLSYLSWAWALDQLMRQDPEAEWEYPEPKMFGETMMVYCSVKAFGKVKTAHLPVMDYRNKPIPSPDAFAVNTAMQRCLVKAIALHGLGLYIYAGEDLPATDNAVAESVVKADVKPLNTKGTLKPDREESIRRVYSGIVDCFEAGMPEKALEAYMAVSDADEKVFLQSIMDKEIKRQIVAAKKKFDETELAQQA